MNKFLERDKLPTIKEEEIDNMNNPIYIKSIEFVGKNLHIKKAPGQIRFTGEF